MLAGPDADVDGMSSYRLVDIAAHIEQRWSVSYGLSPVSRLLHRMGLSWQSIWPAYPKGNAEAQGLCKKPRGHTGGNRGRLCTEVEN